MSAPAYQRVLLKLSGEALMGEQQFGIDPAVTTQIAKDVLEIQQLGVQTAVVMVIYLEEAVVRKRQALGGRLTRPALLEAVTEGALLRLRPKVMTVSTVVASLLPIMWSHSTGAEVMKPLATPVLGGMVSSLIHVLLVTPVIFYWLRERELRREPRDGGERRVDRRILAAQWQEHGEALLALRALQELPRRHHYLHAPVYSFRRPAQRGAWR